MSEEKTPLELSLQSYQVEYNRLCGLIGHLSSQEQTIKEELEQAKTQVKGILKRVKSLQSNQPKKEEVKEEVKDGAAA